MQTFLKKMVIPEKINADEKTLTGEYGRFIAEPYERGYGHTIGNSMRRVLLSSLEGAAVIAVRIKGAAHEYSTIPGVYEDVINILLNLKKLRIKMSGEGPETLYLSVKGKEKITAADIKENANISIINKDLTIAHLEKGSGFEAEIEIAKSSGYLTSEEIREKMNLPMEYIPMDALFSPVRKVHYQVENARVGQKTDYDRLVMEIWTDGTMTPGEAIEKTARILNQSLSPFLGKSAGSEEGGGKSGAENKISRYEQGVDVIELSSRAANCLKVAGIRTIGELLEKKEQDLLAVKNFGEKSLDEIKDRLKEMNLRLGQNSNGGGEKA